MLSFSCKSFTLKKGDGITTTCELHHGQGSMKFVRLSRADLSHEKASFPVSPGSQVATKGEGVS